MTPRQITPEISVSPQIDVADVAGLKALGFRAIMCNRPDGEDPGQPSFAEIAAAAAAEGLEARHVPVTSGMVGDAEAEAFAAALEELPRPLLAYCRSGTRSTILWSLSEAGRRPTAEIVSAARAAGYDVAGLAPRLDAAKG